MTTTPEKIAMLRRLHADSTMVAGPHYRKAACEELPGLLDDIEAAQKQITTLREALRSILMQPMANEWSREQARAALASTEVK
jgi:hypothetical protein